MNRLLLTSFLLMGLVASSCLRLDDFIYNGEKLDAYRLDQYDGEVDFTLPPEMDIPDSLIHLFPLASSSGDQPVNIQGLLVGAMDRLDQDTVILYCHGNKHHLDFYWPRIKLLANLDTAHHLAVMSFDYQGYGLSEGQPSQDGLVRDARAALDWLLARGVTPDRIILYGFSLGSIPATQLAATVGQTGKGWLVLEAPLASSETLVQEASTLSLPAGFLTDLDFDNVMVMSDIAQPFLWLHGEDDRRTPIKTHGEPVFQAYRGSRSIALRIPLAGHDNLPLILGYEVYLQSISSFLKG